MNPISRREFLKASGSLVLGASLPGAVAPAMSQSGTTYYFDYATGDNSYPGTSPGAPIKDISQIKTRNLIQPGNILRLRRGSVWPPSPWAYDPTLDITGKNPAGLCTITDYDDALNPPILDGLEYDNSATGWTHTGSGRWTKAFAFAIHRVMFGGSPANLSIGGLSWSRASALKGSDLTDSTHQWWWNGGTLHIFTGSASQSPPDFYGGLAYASGKTAGGVRVQSSSNLLIQRLRTIGCEGTAWVFETSTSDNHDIQLDDCEALYAARFGFRLLAGGGGFANRRITMNRPVFNTNTDATENEGSGNRQGGSDGFNIVRNYDDIVINDPTCIRARHAGLNCYDEPAFTPGKLTVVARPGFGNFDSTVIEYGRALNLIGSKPSQNTRISGIRSTGQSTQSQFSGTCVVSGCSWKDMRFSKLSDWGGEVSFAWSLGSWDLGPGNSYMVDVTLQNNLIENPWSAPIQFGKRSNAPGSFDANKIKIYNNTIIIDEEHYANLNSKPITTIELFDQNGQSFGPPAFQLVKNNNLISSRPGAQHVSWDNTPSTINGTTGFTGNVENIEGYVDRAGGDYHPTEAGGLKYAGVLGVLGALDSDGLPFNNPPSIAPTEFVGITWRSGASGETSTHWQLWIGLPPGTVQNDVMIAAIGIRPSSATVEAPAGWTLVRRIDNPAMSSNSLLVFRKTAGASEPSAYFWTVNGQTQAVVAIQCFSGVHTTNPIHAEAGQTTPSSLSHSTPSVITTIANTMVVTSHTFSTAVNWDTPPAGMTEGADRAAGEPIWAGQTINGNYAVQGAVGPTGIKTATATGQPNDADVGNTHILALRSATP